MRNETQRAAPLLRPREFERFRLLILERCGIRMLPAKRLLLQNRIGRRLRALGLSTFEGYYDYLQSEEGQRQELDKLWSVVTTHETHFFREAHHFDVLRQRVAPQIIARGATHLRVWSAGCSTGQEAYTLAMVLHDWLVRRRDCELRVLGTDIDADAIGTAREGNYPASLSSEVPPPYLRRYFTVKEGRMQVSPALAALTTFSVQNLAEAQAVRPPFDVIFCRNVMMYLHPDARLRLARVFRDSLAADGVLLLGASETLGHSTLLRSRRVEKTLVYERAAPEEKTP